MMCPFYQSMNDHQLHASDHCCPHGCIVAGQGAPKVKTVGITITYGHVIHHINLWTWSRNSPKYMYMNCIINATGCQEDFTEDSCNVMYTTD